MAASRSPDGNITPTDFSAVTRLVNYCLFRLGTKTNIFKWVIFNSHTFTFTVYADQLSDWLSDVKSALNWMLQCVCLAWSGEDWGVTEKQWDYPQMEEVSVRGLLDFLILIWFAVIRWSLATTVTLTDAWCFYLILYYFIFIYFEWINVDVSYLSSTVIIHCINHSIIQPPLFNCLIKLAYLFERLSEHYFYW